MASSRALLRPFSLKSRPGWSVFCMCALGKAKLHEERKSERASEREEGKKAGH